MSDIGSAQCGDVYVDESDALYRVTSIASSVHTIIVQRIGDAEKFDQILTGPVGAGVWAGFRRIHRPTGGVGTDGYRIIGVYAGCPVYVKGECWHDRTWAVQGLMKKLDAADG